MNRMLISILLLILYCILANGENNNDSVILNKMYNDILSSIPVSKRGIIDSAYEISKKQSGNIVPPDKNTGSKDTAHIVNGEVFFSDETNNNLFKMMQQIDTLRHKRIIHFMTNEPVIKNIPR